MYFFMTKADSGRKILRLNQSHIPDMAWLNSVQNQAFSRFKRTATQFSGTLFPEQLLFLPGTLLHNDHSPHFSDFLLCILFS